MNKVMKFQIIKPIDCDWKMFGDILRTLQRDTHEVMNKSIQICWEYYGFSSEYKNKHGEYPKTKDVLKYSGLDGYCYDKLKTQYNKFNSGNYTNSVVKATDRWKNDLKDILKGEKSITSFKKDIPLDLHNKSIKLHKDDGNYYLDLSLISNIYKKEIQRKSGQFCVLIKVGDNTQRTILERLISGEYGISASQILNKKNKWFVNLCYSFEPKTLELPEENIMGVDMGIVYPVYMAFNNSLARYKIEGGEIERFRKRTERRRNEVLRQGKYCGEGRRGHGVSTRIKPIQIISDKVTNFRNSVNHKYAKYVVEMAVKNNCGTIQLEDLSGISTDNNFLKNWSYYDLRTKIEQKAKEKGIKVKVINPEYTSQRCSKCGYIDRANRPKEEKGQSYFKCVSCGFEVNADFNAARNISTPNIENIIKQQKEFKISI
jgi:putative transposase